MAVFELNGFEEFLTTLERLGRFDEVAPEMMDAGMEVLQKEVVSAASEHVDTGAMVNSIKQSGLQAGYGGGYYMCTRPTGKDKKGVRNMEKMAYLEYGVKGRPAVPVMTKALIRAEPQVVQAMKDVFEKEVGKL